MIKVTFFIACEDNSIKEDKIREAYEYNPA